MSKTLPPASLETQGSQRKKINTQVIGENHSRVNKSKYSKKNYDAVRLVFLVFLPLKGKQEKSKLSVLCVSAVNSIERKTLSGSTFKPPFLGVVVDSSVSSKISFSSSGY